MYCFASKEREIVRNVIRSCCTVCVIISSTYTPSVNWGLGGGVVARRELDTGRLLAVGGRVRIGNFPKEVANNGKDMLISGSTVISHCDHTHTHILF